MKNVCKRLLTIVLFFTLTVMVFESIPEVSIAAAEIDTSDAAIKKLEDRLTNLASEQASLKAKIANTKQDIADEKAYKEDLDKQIQLTTEDIELTNQLIIEYNNQIRDTEVKISNLESNVNTNYEIFKQRLQLSYEEGNVSYLEIVLGAESLAEFIMRVERVASMLDYEQDLMERLDKESADLALLKQSQENDRIKAQELADGLAAKEAELEQQSKEADKYINQLIYSKKSDEYAMQQNELAMAQIDKDIEEILLERQRQQNAAYVGGKFRWPLDAKWNTVSSGYGYRDFDRAVHRGLDIPAAYGSDVYAANGGTVVTAAYHSSYGYYVLIDHGGGLATLYAHNSRLLVAAGDKVSIGDKIAEVGSTGYSTGNHCHFEVRVNGATVDPLNKDDPYVVVP